MFPYAAIGLAAGLYSRDLDALELPKRWFIIAVGAVAVWFFMKYDVFVSPKGFYYKGLKMLCVATALAAVFRFMPFGKVPVRIRSFIVWASGYSMGVYFSHVYIGKLIEELVFSAIGVVPRSFGGGCIVFAVSFVLCWLVSLIPNRHVRALVT